ncbi:MAG: transposase [Paracoccaceae bacterium]
MSAPLPSALRVRFQRLIEQGFSGRAAASRLQLSAATGSRCRVVTSHADTPSRCARDGRKGGASLRHIGPFSRNGRADPDITLFEPDALAEAEGVRVHHSSSIANLLSRLGFSYKKIVGGR